MGGFGIAPSEDLLFVEEVQLVGQVCTWSSVEFDDAGVADYFDQQVEQGVSPEQCGRLWIHTHPGSSAMPSNTDETTFARVFGRNTWAVMFILAQNGSTYARLRFSAGPGGSIELPVSVDYAQPFPATEHGLWLDEYRACVRPAEPPAVSQPRPDTEEQRWWEDQDWFTDFEQVETKQQDSDRSQTVEQQEHDSWLAEWDEYERASNGEFY